MTNGGNYTTIALRLNRNTKQGGENVAIGKITLPAARKNAKLTQKELAELCGVSESTVWSWENGRTEPTVSQALKICEAVGLHIDDIIFLP